MASKAQEKRQTWMVSICAPVNQWVEDHGSEPIPMELVNRALERIMSEGLAMGRTERWQRAVTWFADEILTNDSDEHARWTFLQGMIWLGYANV